MLSNVAAGSILLSGFIMRRLRELSSLAFVSQLLNNDQTPRNHAATRSLIQLTVDMMRTIKEIERAASVLDHFASASSRLAHFTDHYEALEMRRRMPGVDGGDPGSRGVSKSRMSLSCAEVVPG